MNTSLENTENIIGYCIMKTRIIPATSAKETTFVSIDHNDTLLSDINRAANIAHTYNQAYGNQYVHYFVASVVAVDDRRI
jgi:hypothetical protein